MVAPTTPPQLRWRAGVFACFASISKTPRHTIRSSERVKRSRLAPAQVMTITVAKHGDWSLDFDERGPVFDGAQDWRHSVFLTGRAARKVYFASESPANQRLLLAAMEREWKKWEEHKATLPLTQGETAHVEISISKCQNCWHALGKRDLWYRAAGRTLQ